MNQQETREAQGTSQHYQSRALGDALRTTRGLRSLRDIAPEIVGVSVSTLSRVERGAMPDVQTLIAVCEWLKRPITDFIRKTPSALPEELAKEVEQTQRQTQICYFQAGEKLAEAKQLEQRIREAISLFENGKSQAEAMSYLRYGPRK